LLPREENKELLEKAVDEVGKCSYLYLKHGSKLATTQRPEPSFKLIALVLNGSTHLSF
jgi:hypothetical protein